MQLRRLVAPVAAPLIAAGLAVSGAGVAAATPSTPQTASSVSNAVQQGKWGPWMPDDHTQCRNHHEWMRYKRYNDTTHRWAYQYRDTGRHC